MALSRRVVLRVSCTTILFVVLAPIGLHAAGYFQHNLASDIPLLADFTDPNLVNPWGIAAGPFWICNNRTGTYNVYGADGNPRAVVTNVPSAPGKTGPGKCTGAARNNNNAVFQVSPGVTGTWLLDTEDGLITVQQGAQNIIKVDNSGKGAVYMGLAISNNPDFIYAANFNSAQIEAYDGNWEPATLPGNFIDPQVPEGFAPYNIQNLGGKLYVTYARQNAAKTREVNGPGNGHVAVFDLNGNLLQHLISGGPLNSPWGVAIAPASWGDFGGALLIGNFGDGRINAFNLANGSLLGTVSDPAGRAIVNTGLWALIFGNGTNAGDADKLYFTAGISAGSGIESHGLFGYIAVAAGTGAPPAVNDGGVVNNASYTVANANPSPGSIAAIFGSNLTDGTSCVHASGCDQTFDNGNPKRLRTFMKGAQVTINGNPVPVFYATPLQLGVFIPADLTGSTATLQVTVNGFTSAPRTISLEPFAPGIFTLTQDGRGAGAITHNDAEGTVISASSPASPGETIVIYATGLGQVTPAVPTGALPAGQTTTVTTPTVTIDGINAQVVFSGLAGCCVGLNQINVVVPQNVRAGTNANLVLSIGGKQSNTVTLAIGATAGPAAPPPAPVIALSSLSFSQTTVTAGTSSQGRVVLSGDATSDTVVTLSSSNPAAVSVPASITVPAGSNSTSFSFTSSASVSVATVVTITATFGGVTQTATLTVEAAPPTPDPYDY
ncbi:MAG: TIGR03118 family protein [Acidobacteria bacterium]|nr:TIGR03118 family protein [Acidobacteriota bacterium]